MSKVKVCKTHFSPSKKVPAVMVSGRLQPFFRSKEELELKTHVTGRLNFDHQPDWIKKYLRNSMPLVFVVALPETAWSQKLWPKEYINPFITGDRYDVTTETCGKIELGPFGEKQTHLGVSLEGHLALLLAFFFFFGHHKVNCYSSPLGPFLMRLTIAPVTVISVNISF